MARPLRIEYEGAWYHVMNRGAARQAVFVSNAHRDRFLQLLVDLFDRFGKRGQVWFSGLFGILPRWPVRYESNTRALGIT